MILRSCGYAVVLALATTSATFAEEPQPKQRGKRDYAQPDAAEVLKLVLTDWMTNPKVKEQPYAYLIDPEKGEKKPKLERLLIDERSVPKGFELKLPEITIEYCDRSRRELKKGEMAIQVNDFEPRKDGTIRIEFLHSGYGIIGGAFVTYDARKAQGKWTINFVMAFDP